MTGDGPKKVQKWPNRIVNVVQVVQKGQKETKMATPSVIDHLGLFWAHLDPFGPLQTKLIFLSQIDKVGFDGGILEQKINFCLKWSKGVQIGPKGSKMG